MATRVPVRRSRIPMLYDVVIAGAGRPVLSCELAQAGCSVLLLEQAARSTLKRACFGLRGLNAPTLEALDRRGLLDAVAARQVLKPDKGAPPPGTAHWLAQPRPLGGHFAGIPFALDDVDSGRWRDRLPTPVPTDGGGAAVAGGGAGRARSVTGCADRAGCTVQAVRTRSTDGGADRSRADAGAMAGRLRWRPQRYASNRGSCSQGRRRSSPGTRCRSNWRTRRCSSRGVSSPRMACAISTRRACWRWPIRRWRRPPPAMDLHAAQGIWCGRCPVARQSPRCIWPDRCRAPGGLSQRPRAVGR